jgi:hypothetical protein
MMCEYANVCYEAINYNVAEKVDPQTGNVVYDASSWFNEKPEVLKKNPLANLPYIEDGDMVICQSNACLLYLGDKLGLLGNTPQQKIECDMVKKNSLHI